MYTMATLLGTLIHLLANICAVSHMAASNLGMLTRLRQPAQVQPRSTLKKMN